MKLTLPSALPSALSSTLWPVLALGLGLRLIWAALVPVVPVSDQVAYATFARVLREHGVHGWSAAEPTAYWAPGTAMIHAAGFALFGDSGATIVGINLLFSLLLIWVGHRLGTAWFGPRAGLAAALLLAIWPTLVMFTTTLSSELPFLALTALGLLAWDGRRNLAPVSRRVWPLAALIWAAAMMLRPVIQMLPIALGLAALLRRGRQGRGTMAQAFILLGLMLALVQPWAWRNAEVLHSEARISTNFGPNLWMGNNPASDGGYMELPEETKGLTEAARDGRLKDEALRYMLDHPGQTLLRSVTKFIALHDRETIGVAWNDEGLRQAFGDGVKLPLKLLATGFWYLLMLAALGGVVILALRKGFLQAIAHPAVVGWAYFSVLHAVVVVEDRYHLPGGLFLVFLAACFWEAALRPSPHSGTRDSQAPALQPPQGPQA